MLKKIPGQMAEVGELCAGGVVITLMRLSGVYSMTFRSLWLLMPEMFFLILAHPVHKM